MDGATQQYDRDTYNEGRFKVMKISILILLVLISLLSLALGLFTNRGYYRITDMWIGNNSKGSNISYCNNCLWIEFDEGCNRRIKYFFENQHEYDTRLSVGNPVDIKFHEIDGNRYIHKVIPRKEYEYKCS